MGGKKTVKFTKKREPFYSKREKAYFCAEQGGKPQCLICLQVIGVLKEYNAKRHYNTLHKEDIIRI
jgi:hypothetical protein